MSMFTLETVRDPAAKVYTVKHGWDTVENGFKVRVVHKLLIEAGTENGITKGSRYVIFRSKSGTEELVGYAVVAKVFDDCAVLRVVNLLHEPDDGDLVQLVTKIDKTKCLPFRRVVCRHIRGFVREQKNPKFWIL